MGPHLSPMGPHVGGVTGGVGGVLDLRRAVKAVCCVPRHPDARSVTNVRTRILTY